MSTGLVYVGTCWGCMVSLGRGYGNLIESYCVSRSEEASLEDEGSKMYSLLWRTDSWLME